MTDPFPGKLEDRPFHTVEQVAKCWQCHVKTVSQRIESRALVAHRLGGRIRISDADLIAYSGSAAMYADLPFPVHSCPCLSNFDRGLSHFREYPQSLIIAISSATVSRIDPGVHSCPPETTLDQRKGSRS